MSGIGMREQGGGGPSAMDLYGRHSGGADLGGAKAAELESYKMEQQQKYAVPIGGAAMSRPAGAPEWYNYGGLQPAKYDMPSSAKERMMAKQALRESVPATNNGVTRTDPITDFEVDYVQAMKRQAELADFDRYVNTLVDPKKPGNLKWLMEVYPEFVHRRIAQVHDDYDFAIRNQMIDNWGINTLDDLHFKYMVDQGKITGSRLGKRVPVDSLYEVGSLAPYGNRAVAGQARVGDRGNVSLPYASEPGNEHWIQTGGGQPLGRGDRTYGGLAGEMYKTDSAAPGRGVGETQSLAATGSNGARI
jgi:hypothetical protein